MVLVSILSFRLNRYNVWVKFVGRALNFTQVLLVLFITWFELAAINFASSTNVTLLVGFWLTIVGFLIITVAQYWPYFDDAKPDERMAVGLSIVLVLVGALEVVYLHVNLAQSLTHALGGGTVAVIIAGFVANLLGPGWLAGGISSEQGTDAAFRKSALLTTQAGTGNNAAYRKIHRER